MAVAAVFQLRDVILAMILALGAAVVKITTGTCFRWRRHIAGEDNPLAFPLDFGIRDGRCGKQGLGIRMPRLRIEVISIRNFDDNAEVHDRNPR